MKNAVIWLVLTLCQTVIWVVLAYVIVSWLTYFNVLNSRNHIVTQIYRVLGRLVEPILRPFRRILPNLGGVDLSPFAIILLAGFVQRLLWSL